MGTSCNLRRGRIAFGLPLVAGRCTIAVKYGIVIFNAVVHPFKKILGFGTYAGYGNFRYTTC